MTMSSSVSGYNNNGSVLDTDGPGVLLWQSIRRLEARRAMRYSHRRDEYENGSDIDDSESSAESDDDDSDSDVSVDPGVKCPVCLSYHEDITLLPNYLQQQVALRSLAYTPAEQQRCSHRGLTIFVTAHCPVCMEDTGPPNIALACGHVLCKDDFIRLGGRVGASADTSPPTRPQQRRQQQRHLNHQQQQRRQQYERRNQYERHSVQHRQRQYEYFEQQRQQHQQQRQRHLQRQRIVQRQQPILSSNSALGEIRELMMTAVRRDHIRDMVIRQRQRAQRRIRDQIFEEQTGQTEWRRDQPTPRSMVLRQRTVLDDSDDNESPSTELLDGNCSTSSSDISLPLLSPGHGSESTTSSEEESLHELAPTIRPATVIATTNAAAATAAASATVSTDIDAPTSASATATATATAASTTRHGRQKNERFDKWYIDGDDDDDSDSSSGSDDDSDNDNEYNKGGKEGDDQSIFGSSVDLSLDSLPSLLERQQDGDSSDDGLLPIGPLDDWSFENGSRNNQPTDDASIPSLLHGQQNDNSDDDSVYADDDTDDQEDEDDDYDDDDDDDEGHDDDNGHDGDTDDGDIDDSCGNGDDSCGDKISYLHRIDESGNSDQDLPFIGRGYLSQLR